MERNWHRIERRDRNGRVRDWVEVGECARCGRGVDRDFPAEYREVEGQVYCRVCVAGAAPRRLDDTLGSAKAASPLAAPVESALPRSALPRIEAEA